jgi:hypothetical protein
MTKAHRFPIVGFHPEFPDGHQLFRGMAANEYGSRSRLCGISETDIQLSLISKILLALLFFCDRLHRYGAKALSIKPARQKNRLTF